MRKDPLVGVNDSGFLCVFRTSRRYPSYAKMPDGLTEEEQVAWKAIQPRARLIARRKNAAKLRSLGGAAAVNRIER